MIVCYLTPPSGNYGAAAMNLENNNLSRFEQSIFYPVLQNMPTYGIGYVDVRNSMLYIIPWLFSKKYHH